MSQEKSIRTARTLKERLMKWSRARLQEHDVFLLRYSQSNYLAPHLKRILKAFDIEVAIDVGANKGQTVRELRKLGFTGRIVSFEPTPELYRELKRTLAQDPKWTGHQLALGASPGRLTLHRYREESLNSFLTPTAFGAQRFRPMAESPIGEVTVPVERLDDVWSEMIPAGRTLLKIDTQGFDLEVLRGASKHIAGVAAVLTEVPVNPIYKGMPTMNEVFQTMETLGFQLSGLFPVTRDRKLVRMIEANCMFIRSDLLTGDVFDRED
jgi:FkbM family methyltransferase